MIVIGDVHGCFDTLMALMDQIPHRNVCFVGDLIDRGPKSADVVKFVRENDYSCVLGNHEEFMITTPINDDIWAVNGGYNTYKSYEFNREGQFNSDIKWMKHLPLYLELETKDKTFIVSHSACFHIWDLSVDSKEFKDTVLWEREFFHQENKMPENYFNIIGHTPVSMITEFGPCLMIDRGCVYGGLKNRDELCLAAYDIINDKIYEQKCVDKF